MKNPAKKILCTVMALLVVGTSGVVFTGCGSDSNESSSSKVETKAETTTEEVTEPTTEEVTEETTTKATKPKETEPKTTEATVDLDFKATMDSYEEFFNDYVDFMKSIKIQLILHQWQVIMPTI